MMKLGEHLEMLGIEDSLKKVIQSCVDGVTDIAQVVRTGEALGYAGTQNVFGEDQLKLDVLSNTILIDHLKKSGLVHIIASEEMADEEVLHENGEFSLGFDPLDGSSLVDVNFAVGTIIGISPKGTFIGKKGSDMVAAVVAVYGPKTTLYVSLKGKGTHLYLLGKDGFELEKQKLMIAEEGKYFAPGNLRACLHNEKYAKLVDYWLTNQYTLRYSGGMVPDINHILAKGKGVFTYPGYGTEPNGKLRLVYECGPMAFVMVEAGGVASDGTMDLLDKPIDYLDQRTPIFIGSKKEVEKALEYFILAA